MRAQSSRSAWRSGENLNQVALFVDVLVVRDGLGSGAVGGNDGLGASFCDAGANAIGIKAFVSQHLERQTADQLLGLEDVIDVSRRQYEANGIAERIDTGSDLCAQAATPTPDRFICAPVWSKYGKLQEGRKLSHCRVASSPLVRYHFMGIEGTHCGQWAEGASLWSGHVSWPTSPGPWTRNCSCATSNWRRKIAS
jgi:hypothetical protein